MEKRRRKKKEKEKKETPTHPALQEHTCATLTREHRVPPRERGLWVTERQDLTHKSACEARSLRTASASAPRYVIVSYRQSRIETRFGVSHARRSGDEAVSKTQRFRAQCTRVVRNSSKRASRVSDHRRDAICREHQATDMQCTNRRL
eukprot:199646-Rhodomonas_salina.3